MTIIWLKTKKCLSCVIRAKFNLPTERTSHSLGKTPSGINSQLTGHDSPDHELYEVDLDSLVFPADELEETLGVWGVDAVLVESRRRHDARRIVDAASDSDLAPAEHLQRNRVELCKNCFVAAR